MASRSLTAIGHGARPNAGTAGADARRGARGPRGSCKGARGSRVSPVPASRGARGATIQEYGDSFDEADEYDTLRVRAEAGPSVALTVPRARGYHGLPPSAPRAVGALRREGVGRRSERLAREHSSMQVTEVREIVPHVPEGLELGLRNYWYPILQSEALGREKPLGIQRLGEHLVLWRDATGAPRTLHDRCPHRAAKLSIGRILDGDLQCIFHGLRFDGDGRCTLIPWEPEDSPLRSEVCISAYPTRELGGYIWAYLGDTSRFPAPPLEDEIPEELTKPDEFLWFRLPDVVWHANWLLAVDGSDPLHAVTLHAETQAVASEDRKSVV